jgi:P pilus assembly chaperone PapD
MTIQEVVFVLLFAVVLMAAAELMVWGLDVVFWAPSKASAVKKVSKRRVR